MIHRSTLKELTEDELALMYAVVNHLFVTQLNYPVKYEWLAMVKPSVLEGVIHRCNLKEEYYSVRDSLLTKLKQGTY